MVFPENAGTPKLSNLVLIWGNSRFGLPRFYNTPYYQNITQLYQPKIDQTSIGQQVTTSLVVFFPIYHLSLFFLGALCTYPLNTSNLVFFLYKLAVSSDIPCHVPLSPINVSPCWKCISPIKSEIWKPPFCQGSTWNPSTIARSGSTKAVPCRRCRSPLIPGAISTDPSEKTSMLCGYDIPSGHLT